MPSTTPSAREKGCCHLVRPKSRFVKHGGLLAHGSLWTRYHKGLREFLEKGGGTKIIIFRGVKTLIEAWFCETACYTLNMNSLCNLEKQLQFAFVGPTDSSVQKHDELIEVWLNDELSDDAFDMIMSTISSDIDNLRVRLGFVQSRHIGAIPGAQIVDEGNMSQQEAYVGDSTVAITLAVAVGEELDEDEDDDDDDDEWLM